MQKALHHAGGLLDSPVCYVGEGECFNSLSLSISKSLFASIEGEDM